ncbi:MAG TPA: hypothetical protein VN520_37825 [Streptomyces sp.]|uniref:hypothetical protein n=1 Tax=Streptomyces sp. TaxID=1931 RepID=UPI002BF217E9|nr:hypothetical protein [Streptomyces sp.]HWU12044.1 hypothetical protein [Streptomyces sp.]
MGSGEGGEQKLASSSSDKQRAATYMTEHQIPGTEAAARMAAGGGAVRVPYLAAPTAPVSPLLKQDTGLKGLSGWASDQGVSDALVAWQGQANRLTARLQQELAGLKKTRATLNDQDLLAGAQADSIRLPSSFDGM